MTQRHARQVGILLQLRSRPYVSAAALSCRFGVDVRTIYLDIDLLSASGLRLSHTAPGSPEALDAYLSGVRSREQLRRLGQRAYACQQRSRLSRLAG
ncbi:HTH domain-containing protein [Dactylosporangium fulvum]|uniref:HTH domain-containing protein n=1 Tax=Dactylosporangium fulvum TaxID=53359 RepID=A0ABY5WAH8_9ACTN|nr:HTH domain-containing protein [Dactylosporangium fulvum]UWP86390.1 HTH domain-containing protein [Dactylosporangium fulvum]